MTDPGWDIPGVPREDPFPAGGSSGAGSAVPGAASAAGASASARAGSAGRAGMSARKPRPSASASASAGYSAGAFAGAVAGAPPAAGSSGGAAAASTADTISAGTTPADSRAGDNRAASATQVVPAIDPAQALAYLSAGLDFLAHADAAQWPAGMQADCLRALAVAESRLTAAHASVLAAFSVPGGGLNGDGHRSPRMWLTWQAQATRRAAAGQVASMRQLQAHPLIAAALASGQLSVSWARQLIDWSDRLPAEHRDDADTQLLAAAQAGAGLASLAGLAEDLRRRHAAPDETDDDGFEDRALRLATTFDGAGRIEGDLTPRCAAAVDTVLDSLAAKRGPEDTRTLRQRWHDALEEACLRLIAADGLPQRAGQPVRLELTITLDELASGGLGSAAGPGAACDTAIQPVVTGHVDDDLLQRLADPQYRQDLRAAAAAATSTDDRCRDILQQAIALLSGPAGHAAALRRKLTGIPAATISLPLDIAATLDTIPAHLRRAVKKRDQHCRFPGCDMPPAGCDVHHIVHRKDGGRHALTNLTLLCRFHHLIAIHRWGWQITLNPDGTTTAVSPDATKTLHSHARPTAA